MQNVPKEGFVVKWTLVAFEWLNGTLIRETSKPQEWGDLYGYCHPFMQARTRKPTPPSGSLTLT